MFRSRKELLRLVEELSDRVDVLERRVRSNYQELWRAAYCKRERRLVYTYKDEAYPVSKVVDSLLERANCDLQWQPEMPKQIVLRERNRNE